MTVDPHAPVDSDSDSSWVIYPGIDAAVGAYLYWGRAFAHNQTVAVGRAERMAERKVRIAAFFDEARTDTVVAVLELTEMAWHDCYREVSPPERIIDEILLCSQGDVAKLVEAALLAVMRGPARTSASLAYLPSAALA